MERPMLRAAVDNALSTGGHKTKRAGDAYTCVACHKRLIVPDEMDRGAAEAMFKDPFVRECAKGLN